MMSKIYKNGKSKIPFIKNLHFINRDGDVIEFDAVTNPHVIYLQSTIGDFGLVFQDNQTLSIGLPPNQIVGIRFLVTPHMWQKVEKFSL